MNTGATLYDVMTPREYRRALAVVPTSVVLVSGMVADEPIGMVIGTFTSVSLEPPLVGFFGDLRSRTLEPLLTSEFLTFSLLRQTDLEICDAFRLPMNERFASIDWHVSDFGTPELPESVLTIHTRVHAVTPAGDHKSVLAEVLDVRKHDSHARPLVFFRNRLSRLDPGQVLDDEMWQLGWSD